MIISRRYLTPSERKSSVYEKRLLHAERKGNVYIRAKEISLISELMKGKFEAHTWSASGGCAEKRQISACVTVSKTSS